MTGILKNSSIEIKRETPGKMFPKLLDCQSQNARTDTRIYETSRRENLLDLEELLRILMNLTIFSG